MSYRTVGQGKFSGGLRLREGADVVQPDQAVDLLNVLFLPAGGVRQRDGFQRFSAVEGTNRYDSIAAYYTSGGTRQLIAGNGARIEAIDTAGAITGTPVTTAAAFPHYFARYGAPGSEHIYIANGTDTVRRWTGSAFATPAYTGTTPTGKFLTVQATDNRLVNARTAANPDRVLFSDAGVPTTLTANSYVDLHPGDGEGITALVAWREYVFAFKESKFFVFYGNSVDSAGSPVFNFRPVTGGIGCVGAACASPEGVYFLDRRGIYRTTGQAPELVSGALDPLFLGYPSVYYLGGTLATSAYAGARLWWHAGRLYFAYATTSANDRLAVYSPEDGWWTLYDIPAAAMCSFRIGTRDELVFAYASGLKHIARYYEGSSYLADDLTTSGTGGTAITSRWRQGWVDYGSQDVKGLRQTKLWGEGAASIGIVKDFEQTGRSTAITFSQTSGVTWNSGVLWNGGSVWGPALVTKPWMMSMSVSGTVLALTIANSTLNTSWALRRLEHGFRDARSPEVRRTEVAA